MSDRMKVAVARLMLGAVLAVIAVAGMSTTEEGTTAHDLSGVLLFCGLLGLAVGGVGAAIAVLRD